MNIAFFLTPKEETVYENINSSLKQVMDKMEKYRYTAIPIIDSKGRYFGTLTEGDILWNIKNVHDLNFKDSANISLSQVPMHVKNKPVSINSHIENLIVTSMNQNFVPVVDDDKIFIGIIKRSDIINYCYKNMFEK